jgi:hypothetical protein
MRALRFLNVAILSVLVGCTAVAFAQEEKPQDDKPARQEEPKPEPKQDETRPAHQDEAQPARADKQEEKQDQKRDQDQSRDQMKPEQQAGTARPAGNGSHIPDDKFKAHFGRGHHFHAKGVIVQGQPQFQYGGYSFQLVDAWPADWAYTDDCYIDYIDGEYFLFDLRHPGVRIALTVVL